MRGSTLAVYIALCTLALLPTINGAYAVPDSNLHVPTTNLQASTTNSESEAVTNWDNVQPAKLPEDAGGCKEGPMYSLASAIAMVGVANASGKRRRDKDTSETEGSVCEILNQVVEILDNPIREKILKALPPGVSKTFDELKSETGISTGGLHHQLDVLKRYQYVSKSQSRPAQWFRTEKFNLLIDQAQKGLQESYPIENIQKPEYVEADT